MEITTQLNYSQKLQELQTCNRWNLCYKNGELFKASPFRVVLEKIKGLWFSRMIFNSQDGTNLIKLKKGIAEFIKIGSFNSWINDNQKDIFDHLAKIVNIEKDSFDENIIRNFINNNNIIVTENDSKLNFNDNKIKKNKNKIINNELEINPEKIFNIFNDNLEKDEDIKDIEYFLKSNNYPSGNYVCIIFSTSRSHNSTNANNNFIQKFMKDKNYDQNLPLILIGVISQGLIKEDKLNILKDSVFPVLKLVKNKRNKIEFEENYNKNNNSYNHLNNFKCNSNIINN
ncbi:MAG: hypothetical protein Q8K60_08335 [Parachlamydiaceae bacterium]|nr:hypothetical protein [Parachlamydiaceae bacterium]